MAKQTGGKVPQVRFKGFDGEWEEKTLGEVADVYDGTHQTPNYTKRGIMFLSVENIRSLKSNKFISEKAFKKEFKVFPQKGDVLMTRIGDIGTANVVESSELLAYYVSLALFKLNGLDAYFLKQCISSDSVTRELWHRTLHIAFPKKINKNEIEKVVISLPEFKSEQTKIGEYFRELDGLIGLHQRKHDKLVMLKKAMLQKMFPQPGASTPEIRFKGFEGDWVVKKLGDLTETGFTNGVFNDPSKVGRGYRLINVKDMFSGSSIDVDNLSLVDLDENEFKKNRVQYGDIFFTRSSLVKEGIACSNVNLSAHQDITFDGHLIRMQPCRKITDSIFLSYAFKTASSRRQFILGGKTTTMTTIGQSDIAVVEVALPTKTEQQKIGAYFRTLDGLIAKHAIQLQKLQQIKSACLEKMFV